MGLLDFNQNTITNLDQQVFENPKQAETTLLGMLEFDPDDANLHKSYAQSLANQGRYQAALEHCGARFYNDPNNDECFRVYFEALAMIPEGGRKHYITQEQQKYEESGIHHNRLGLAFPALLNMDQADLTHDHITNG